MTASAELVARLERLHASGQPGGLAPAGARALAEALARGAPLVDAGARAGLSAELLAPAEVAADPVGAVLAALPIAQAAAAHELRLRGAATYPLVLAATALASAAIVLGIGRTALVSFSDGAPPSLGGPALAATVACGALVALSAAVFARPPLGPWRSIDTFRFLGTVRALVGAGAPLAAALRAAAPLLRRGARAGEALAAALEAGGAAEAVDLLDPYERSVLVGGARAGMAEGALDVLVEHRRRALDREVPAAAAAIHVVGLLVAGVGVLAVGIGWFTVYAAGVLE